MRTISWCAEVAGLIGVLSICACTGGTTPTPDTGNPTDTGTQTDSVVADVPSTDTSPLDAPVADAADAMSPTDASGPPDPSTYSVATLQKICVMATSCSMLPSTGVPDTSVGYCVSFIRDAAARGSLDPDERFALACLANAADCSAVVACLTRGHTSNECGTGAVSICAGTLVVSCASAITSVSDCALRGEVCTMFSSSGVNAAECTSGAMCTGTSSTCAGTRSMSCNGSGHVINPDCALVYRGGQCLPGGDGGAAGCATAGSACAGDEPRCETNTLVRCLDGRQARTDCAAIYAGSCAGSAGAAACQPTPPACDSSMPTAHDSCSGNMLSICLNGAVTQVDCGMYGFHSCAATHCVP